MNAARADLPTLTEVIDIAPLGEGPGPAAPPLPVQVESVALESGSPDPWQAPAQAGSWPLKSEPAPAVSSSDGLAYDEELVAQVMVRLQPRLEAWVEAQVRRALAEALPVWVESAALTIARDLRSEMPELLSVALDEVHRQHRR
jgi:hypothetical protein